MLSTIVTLLSLGVMLLMIAGFIISALRERRPYVYADVVQAQHASLPLHDKRTYTHAERSCDRQWEASLSTSVSPATFLVQTLARTHLAWFFAHDLAGALCPERVV